MKIGGDNPELGEYACISTGGEGNEEMDRISGVSNQKRPLFVHFFIILIQHLGNRIWPSLAQDSITEVMIYNHGYAL